MSKSVPEIAAELQRLQRKRSIVIKSRIMQANRLQAVVAGTIGYRSDMTEKERRAKFTEAASLIKQVVKGEATHDFEGIIIATHEGIGAFDLLQAKLEKSMLSEAKQLPAAAWVADRRQLGFGLLSLAIVVGEAGNLANYSNPAKLWRRFGCAPWSFDGETKMGATWKSGREGKLPSMEWESFGYCPRRRSIAFLIGDNIVKQNGAVGTDDDVNDTEDVCVGPYRSLYDLKKDEAAVAHPSWTKLRCHRHAMLIATKRLLRNLWCYWNGRPEINVLAA